MEAEDSFLIDMPLGNDRKSKCCDYRDFCCIIITVTIFTAVVGLVVAVFVIGFKPYTIK
jgi:hypothetical protein